MYRILFLLLLCVARVTAQESPPYHWPPSHDYDVQHYRIQISFDIDNKLAEAKTAITFKPFKNGFKELVLDAGKMNIKRVKLGSVDLAYKYEDAETLKVQMDKEYPLGAQVTVQIEYTVGESEGLKFIRPSKTDPTRPRQVWTQGQPKTNHYWFPCYDYPNDKATTETIITVEDRFLAISNGVLLSVKPASRKGWKVYHWRMDQPFSAYLISVVVGEFAEIKSIWRGKPIISYVYKDEIENAKLSYGNLLKMVDFFSKRLDYPYPYNKYVQTTVRDFGGAMENITATTISDRTVHDRRAHLDIDSDGIVAHELAHQWFGDLTTCRDWGELWLNEGFATFLANAWIEERSGSEEYLYSIYSDQQSYLNAWQAGIRRPISTKRYRDPNSVFDVYSYARAGAVLHMLREEMGQEQFWRGISYFLKHYKYKNVDTQDLITALEESTGQNLQWFFDQWIHKMGHPEFKVSTEYNDFEKMLKVVVEQTQKADEGRRWYSHPDFFSMHLNLGIWTSEGERVERIWIDAAKKEFTFTLDSKPLFINFDRGNSIIKTVKYERSLDEAIAQLHKDSDMTGRLRAAIELKDRPDSIVFQALAKAATDDKFWAVRRQALSSIKKIEYAKVRPVVLEGVKDSDPRVRRVAVAWLAENNPTDNEALFVELCEKEPSYQVVDEAVKGLAATGTERARQTLYAMLEQDSWQDSLRKSALRGLVVMKDQKTRELSLKYIHGNHSVELKSASLGVLGGLGADDGQTIELLGEYLKSETFQLCFSAAQGLVSLNDPRAIPYLEEFIKRESLPSFVKPMIRAAIKRLSKSR